MEHWFEQLFVCCGALILILPFLLLLPGGDRIPRKEASSELYWKAAATPLSSWEPAVPLPLPVKKTSLLDSEGVLTTSGSPSLSPQINLFRKNCIQSLLAWPPLGWEREALFKSGIVQIGLFLLGTLWNAKGGFLPFSSLLLLKCRGRRSCSASLTAGMSSRRLLTVLGAVSACFFAGVLAVQSSSVLGKQWIWFY